MEERAQINTNWRRADRTKLSLLILSIISAGIFSGVVMLNVVFFIIALSALIILTVRFGYNYAVFAGLISGVFCLVFYGEILTLMLALMVLIPGYLMGYKSRVFSPTYSIIFWGMLPFLFPLILLVVYYPELISQAPLMIAEMNAMIDENAAIMGLSGPQLELMYLSIETTVVWVLRLAPGILFTMFITIVFFAYLGASGTSSYFGAILPRFKPLHLWKPNELLLIPLGISLLFVLMGGHWLKIVGENALVFLIHLYAFLGICLVDFYFKRISIPAAIRLIVYILVLVGIIVVIPVLAIISVLDSHFDFRKISQVEDKS